MEPPELSLADPEPPGSASTPTGNSAGPRAAYPGSAAPSANFTLNGQTSWEVWQLSRFVAGLGERGRSSDAHAAKRSIHGARADRVGRIS